MKKLRFRMVVAALLVACLAFLYRERLARRLCGVPVGSGPHMELERLREEAEACRTKYEAQAAEYAETAKRLRAASTLAAGASARIRALEARVAEAEKKWQALEAVEKELVEANRLMAARLDKATAEAEGLRDRAAAITKSVRSHPEYAALKKALDAAGKTLKKQAGDLAAAAKNLAALRKGAVALKAAAAAKAAEADALKKTLAEERNDAEGLKKSLEAKQVELEELRGELAAAQKKIDALEKQLDAAPKTGPAPKR